MPGWVAVVPEETYERERLYAYERLVLTADGEPRPAPGDVVALVAALEPPVLFGLGRVRAVDEDDVAVAYTHRVFDHPVPVAAARLGFTALASTEYEALAGRVDAGRRVDADKSVWFVSVALPIEAPSPAEAVREFWTYVDKLGPRELPAYVWPAGDELAMQAYVHSTETNLDPEEDD